MVKSVDPQPVKQNKDGSIALPSSSSTSATTQLGQSFSSPAVDMSSVRSNVSGGGSTQDMMLSLFGSAGGGSSYVDKSDPLVLVARGKKPTKANNSTSDSAWSAREQYAQDDLIKSSDASNLIYKDDNYRVRITKQLIDAGLLSPGDENNLAAISQAWNQIISDAANFNTAGNARTPEEVIKLYAIQKKRAAGVPITTTTTTTDNYSASKTEGMLSGTPSQQGVLQQMLGRNPTAHEITAYQAGLNQAAAANPTVNQTTTTQDMAGNQTINQNVSGGIDANLELSKIAERDPEYGAYQASTTYMDALRKAVGAFI